MINNLFFLRSSNAKGLLLCFRATSDDSFKEFLEIGLKGEIRLSMNIIHSNQQDSKRWAIWRSDC